MTDVDVLIIGAGLGGINAACRLERDCPAMTYAILEGRDGVGGTWDLFRYPGIRSDSDAFTLGYPFRPWTGRESITSGESLRTYIAGAAADAGVDRHIRFRTKAHSGSWSSTDARWTVRSTCDDQETEFRARFLYVCAGYYDYDRAHQPDFDGAADFTGTLVWPQFWPADLDHTGKRVVVIGSGATAVTLVPAMAATAAHVTMLQRSPSYMFVMPAVDKLAVGLQKVLPAQAAHRVVRTKNVLTISGIYALARKRPETFKRLCRKMALHYLADPAYVDAHFTPSYEPWDQRLCLIPNGDLFTSIRSGAASVVTDHIDRFVPDGIRLRSGAVLAADIVVAATGLSLKPLGGITLEVDGAALDVADTLAYRAMMLSGVPNLAYCFGYTNASWTLRSDLSARYVCQLLNHMRSRGHEIATPAAPAGMGRKPFLDLTSGYVRRGIDRFPRSGTSRPWLVSQNYLRDILAAKRADPGEDMVFTSRTPAKAAAGA